MNTSAATTNIAPNYILRLFRYILFLLLPEVGEDEKDEAEDTAGEPNKDEEPNPGRRGDIHTQYTSTAKRQV